MNAEQKPIEEPFGLQPIAAGVTQSHVLQWIDPTFDEAAPQIDSWLRLREEGPDG